MAYVLQVSQMVHSFFFESTLESYDGTNEEMVPRIFLQCAPVKISVIALKLFKKLLLSW